MKKLRSFEVVIPFAVFGHLSALSVENLLSWFNVKFEHKGVSENGFVYLIIAPSFESAIQVRNLFDDLRRLVLVSAFSPMDRLRCDHWTFGEIRFYDDDELDDFLQHFDPDC